MKGWCFQHDFWKLITLPDRIKVNNGFVWITQEFAGEDTSDLFLEERETALRQAQEEKHKLQMSVPGILNPHEIPEEMCD